MDFFFFHPSGFGFMIPNMMLLLLFVIAVVFTDISYVNTFIVQMVASYEIKNFSTAVNGEARLLYDGIYV